MKLSCGEKINGIEAVLRALSHTTSAVGKEQIVIVEKLSVSVDEEAKYVITIKKK